MNTVYHSKLTQIVACICGAIIFLVVVGGIYAVASLTLIYFGVIESKLHSNEWLLLIVYGSFVYCCRVAYLFYRFFKTLKGIIKYDIEKVRFELNGQTTTFQWKELARSREYADCQIFTLFDSHKAHIFTIWEFASGYEQFREAFSDATGK